MNQTSKLKKCRQIIHTRNAIVTIERVYIWEARGERKREGVRKYIGNSLI